MRNDPQFEVSVIIAAYNAETMLAHELQALAQQDVPFEFEVLICDNGSTDGTVALAEDWRRRGLPHLRVIDASQDRGPGAARNVGAAQALAPLLVFCDADDVVQDGWLAAMHEALQHADFVAGICRRPQRNTAPGAPAEYLDYSLYRMPIFPQLPASGAGNMGIRTEVFRRVGGFDRRFRTGEDDDLSWRIQLAGHPLIVQPDAVIVLNNRSGLRATFRQGFSYGAGEKALAFKYARVIEAFQGLPELPVPSGPVGAHGIQEPETVATPGVSNAPRARLFRRVVRKLVSIRRPSDLSNVTYRVADRLGARFGRIDRTLPQLEAPAHPEAILRRD